MKLNKKFSAYERKFHKKYLVPMPKKQENKDKLINFVQNQLKRTKILSNTINISINEKEFFLSLNELNRILYNLTPYEEIFNFDELPSRILRILYENRVKYIDQLYERIKKPTLQ